MKRMISILICLMASGFVFSQSHPDPVTLAIGAPAPPFNLPGVDGKNYSLKDFSSAKAFVVIFSCNHCPTAQAYEDRMIALVNEFKNKQVAFAVISPNDPERKSHLAREPVLML